MLGITWPAVPPPVRTIRNVAHSPVSPVSCDQRSRLSEAFDHILPYSRIPRAHDRAADAEGAICGVHRLPFALLSSRRCLSKPTFCGIM